jgi:hypothetical protein
MAPCPHLETYPWPFEVSTLSVVNVDQKSVHGGSYQQPRLRAFGGPPACLLITPWV